MGQIVQLSQHKFASNVVEKCLQYGQPEGRQVYCHSACMFCDTVIDLMLDMYIDRLSFLRFNLLFFQTLIVLYTVSLLQTPAVTQYLDSYFLPMHASIQL